MYSRGDPCGRPVPLLLLPWFSCCYYSRGDPCGRPVPLLLSPGSPPDSLSVDMTIRAQTPFSHISFKREAARRAASYIVGATLAVALVFCGRPGFLHSPWFFGCHAEFCVMA